MKTTTRFTSSMLVLVGLAMTISSPAHGADPTPATKPDATSPNAGPDAKRLTFLGDQLSADEAAITAINKALIQAGYHAALANDKATNASKGNELMDRKGGAPVPWQQFYGRTARDFIMHDRYSPVYHQVDRPDQFDYVYRANNNQIESAKAEVDALGKKVDALLARRRELETEQSSLWATMAFESIGNRDIPLQPLYRDELKAKPSPTDDNRPDGARVAAMRAAVLYLRTLAHTTEVLSDRLDTDQESAYTALRDTLQKAGDQLTESAATFADTAGVDPVEAKQMSDVASQDKQIQSLCKDVCEAFRKYKDSDAAGEGEEQRKLLFRGTLQDSLFSFAEAAGQMDDVLRKMSETWQIQGQTGVISPDKPLEAVAEAAHVAPASQNSTAEAAARVTSPPPATQEAQGRRGDELTPAATAQQNSASNVSNPTAAENPAAEGTKVGRQVDLLKLADPTKDAVQGTWTLNNGVLASNSGDSGRFSRIEFPYTPPLEYDYRIVFSALQVRSSIIIQPICCDAGHQFSWDINANTSGLSGRGAPKNFHHEHLTTGQKCVILLKVRKGDVQGYLNDVLAMDFKTDYSDVTLLPKAKLPHNDTIGICLGASDITIESAEVVEITGDGHVLPR